MFDLKELCENEYVSGFILESNSISDIMGSVCKMRLNFSSCLISEEFNIITLIGDMGSASLTLINSIEYSGYDDDNNIHILNIVCGFEGDLKIYRLYIRVNEKNKYRCLCTRCNKQFDVLDAHNGITINKTFGYGSRFDGEKIEFNLCLNCLDEIVSGGDRY